MYTCLVYMTNERMNYLLRAMFPSGFQFKNEGYVNTD